MTLELLVEPASPSQDGLLLATVACGDAFFGDWERYSLPSWERYARRWGYGLAVLKASRLPVDANVAWNKFLLPMLAREELGHLGSALVLDADQVFSPVAPQINGEISEGEYGLVRDADFSGASQEEGKLLSFLRRSAIDPRYPLDSVSLMTEADWLTGDFVDLGGHLPVSSGFILVPPGRVDHLASLTRFILDPEAEWDGGGGDQMIATRELQSVPHRMLDRRWQGIWPAIMARRFAFLYFAAPVEKRVAAGAIISALLDHWCLHFSTSWPEKQYWHVDWMDLWDQHIPAAETEELEEYLRATIVPREYGRLAAPDVRMIE